MTFTVPSLDMMKNEATSKAFDTFLRAAGKQTVKLTKAEVERQKAFGATMTDFLKSLDEEARVGFFLAFEAVASGPNRRKIATHPLRPNELIDNILAEVTDEDAAAESQEAAPSLLEGKSASGKSKAAEASSDPFDDDALSS